MDCIKKKWTSMSTRLKGFSLLELLLCVAILGFILLALGEMEIGIRRTNERFASALKEKQSADVLLGLVFDVHRAGTIGCIEESKLELRLPEGKVMTWTAHYRTLTRDYENKKRIWMCGERIRFQVVENSGDTVRIVFPGSGITCTLRILGGVK